MRTYDNAQKEERDNIFVEPAPPIVRLCLFARRITLLSHIGASTSLIHDQVVRQVPQK